MEERNIKIKRLMYQSYYRGCKETDIILGKFAKQYLSTFSDAELIMFEDLLKIDDKDLFDWVSGKRPVPSNINNMVIDKLLNFKVVE